MFITQVGHAVRLQDPGTRPLSADMARALPDYSFAFEGETVDGYGAYYFCNTTRQLDDKFGDLFHKILDLEGALLVDLKKRVLEQAPALAAAAAAAAELDCLVALARGARQLNLHRPTLTRDNVLRIKNGRHLLQEQIVDVFVPNDTDVGAAQRRINVITGPNFSGKSVYLVRPGAPACRVCFSPSDLRSPCLRATEAGCHHRVLGSCWQLRARGRRHRWPD